MIVAEFAYSVGFLILLVWVVISIIKKMPANRVILWSLFIIYIDLVLSITLFPIPYQHGVVYGYPPPNIVPFKSIIDMFHYARLPNVIMQIGGNMAMFFPLGILLPLLGRNEKFLKSFIIALCMAVAIELLQGGIGLIIGYTYRMVDIDDVILNVLGYIIGFLILKIVPNKLKSVFQ